MTSRKPQLVAQLQDNERLLRGVFGTISEAQADEIKVSSLWTVRDELAHIVSWIEEFLKEAEFLLAAPGTTIPWEIATDGSATAYDSWNRARIKELSTLTLSALLDRYQAANAELMRLIETLQDEQLGWSITIPWEGERTIPLLIAIHTEHEQKHRTRSSNALGSAYPLL